MPKISVIIPVYNHLSALKKCLPALVRQTFSDYEIILVNDGSTDSLSFWLREFIADHPSLPLKIFNQENRGRPQARNFGFAQATGEYVLFCDADIIMRSDMLEKLNYTLDNHPQAAYVYSSFIFGWKLFRLWEFDPARLKTMPYIHTTALLKREYFPGWDENLKKFQDWDLWLTLLEKGQIGVWLPEVLFKADVSNKDKISSWLPSFFYGMPWQKLGLKMPAVDEYRAAREIILEKHHLKIPLNQTPATD